MTEKDKWAQIRDERRRQFNADLRQVMETKAGRSVFKYIMYDQCGLEASSFHAESSVAADGPAGIKDGIAAAMHTARHEGRREVAIELSRLLWKKCPGLMAELLIVRTREEALILERLTQQPGDDT